jgi:hypothetical protein
MPDVIEQLRRYGEVVEQHAVDVAAVRPVGARPARRHRLVVASAAACIVLVGVVVGVVTRDGGPASRSVGVAPRQVVAPPVPPPVPPGWKAVTYGPVQFAVPAEWPVYDDGRCFDPSVYGVYLVFPVASCSGTERALNVRVARYAGGTTGVSGIPTQLNGLQAVVSEPDPVDNRPQRYMVALPDQQVIIELEFISLADASIAHQIISTVGAAEVPAPFPDQPPPIPPTAKPGPSEFCAAVEEFRAAGVTDSATGAIKPEALPYLQRIRDAAPSDSRPPVDVVIAWVQQGAPLPTPADVAQAELQTTQDWARRC